MGVCVCSCVVWCAVERWWSWSQVIQSRQCRNIQIEIQLPRQSLWLFDVMNESIFALMYCFAYLVYRRIDSSTSNQFIRCCTIYTTHDDYRTFVCVCASHSIGFFQLLSSRSTSAWRPQVYDKFDSTPLTERNRNEKKMLKQKKNTHRILYRAMKC